MEQGGRLIRFTFKLPQTGAYVGPPSLGAGIAKVDQSGIMLELGYRTEEPRQVSLAVSEIRSVELKTGLLGNRLVIEAEHPAATSGVSNNEQGTLILKVPRGELEAARQAESLLKICLARDFGAPDQRT